MSRVFAETNTEGRLECVETRFQSSGLDASPGVQKGRDPHGQTQDLRERLHLRLGGLGMPQYPLRGDGGSSRGRWSGASVFTAETAALDAY